VEFIHTSLTNLIPDVPQKNSANHPLSGPHVHRVKRAGAALQGDGKAVLKLGLKQSLSWLKLTKLDSAL